MNNFEEKIIVLNVKKDTAKFPFFYIGRGSPLGNPYFVGATSSSCGLYQVSSREEAIENFKNSWPERKNLPEIQTELKKILDELLKGNIVYLGCFCKPLSCHGDFIKEELVKSLENE